VCIESRRVAMGETGRVHGDCSGWGRFMSKVERTKMVEYVQKTG